MPECKVCKVEFMPARPLQSVCSLDCARKQAEQVRAKTEKKDYREAKERLKKRGDWAREAQNAFNAFIRERDRKSGYGCISCGTFNGKANAGHYRSVGSCPELRFEPINVHLQCERCNRYLSGNLIAYRAALVLRIGLEKVEWLEGPHEVKKYSVDDFKRIKAEYKQKLKEIKNVLE